MVDMKMIVERFDEVVFKGDGGEYHIWSNSTTPFLSAGKIHMRPHAFAPPHYGDSSKICCVLEGTITAGLMARNSTEEKIVQMKKGDAMPVLAGDVSWWFNCGDTNGVVVFFGETSKALVPRKFTHFLMAGVLGAQARSQPDFINKTLGLDQNESKDIVTQDEVLMKLDHGMKFPKASDDMKDKLYASINDPYGEVSVKGGGVVSSLTEKNLPLLGEIGLSVRFVKLEGNAMLAPSYVVDGSVQIFYVATGSGRIMVISNEEKPALDSKVGEGDLVVVPQFFVTTLIADACGMEVYSVINSSKPVFRQITGNTSVWKALSPVVLQATLNMKPEFVQLFSSKNSEINTIIPPSS
ncbi:hypothetical protein R6Q57_006132 [Mikania cordata]